MRAEPSSPAKVFFSAVYLDATPQRSVVLTRSPEKTTVSAAQPSLAPQFSAEREMVNSTVSSPNGSDTTLPQSQEHEPTYD